MATAGYIKNNFLKKNKTLEAVASEVRTPDVKEEYPSFMDTLREFSAFPETKPVTQAVEAPAAPAPEPSFSHPDFSETVYQELLPVFRTACAYEGVAAHLVEQRARAFAVLFTDANQALDYIKKSMKKTGSFAEATDATLPNAKQQWNVPTWRKFVNKYGQDATRLLQQAPVIEGKFAIKAALLEKNEGIKWEFEKSTIGELQNLRDEQLWSQEYLDQELAQLFKQQKQGEPAFIAAFNLLQDRIKKIEANGGHEADNIPDIGTIDGAGLGHPDYYMVKMSKGDPRALILSSYIPFCGALMQLNATSPDVGIYAWFHKTKGVIDPKHDLPVAKVTALITTEGNLLYSAWEREKQAKDLCVPFLEEATKRVMLSHHSIQRVQLGKTITGHSADEWKQFKPAKALLQAKDSKARLSDHNTQYLVMDRDMLKAKYSDDVLRSEMQQVSWTSRMEQDKGSTVGIPG